MSSRRNRQGHAGRGSELRVKEVIVPGNSDQTDANVRHVNEHAQGHAHRINSTHSTIKLGDHEITAFCGLVALEKPPIEDYVQGTRKKTYRKKKPKHNQRYSKVNSTYCDSFFQTNEKFHLKNEIVSEMPLTSKTLAGRALNSKIERKIKCYENKIKEEEENNCRRQRRLEKHSIEELENLAETWMGLVQKRKNLREQKLEEDILSVPKPFRYTRPVDISLISKKYWKDESDMKTRKSPTASNEREREESHRPSVEVDLEDEFLEKLVFVDSRQDD